MIDFKRYNKLCGQCSNHNKCHKISINWERVKLCSKPKINKVRIHREPKPFINVDNKRATQAKCNQKYHKTHKDDISAKNKLYYWRFERHNPFYNNKNQTSGNYL